MDSRDKKTGSDVQDTEPGATPDSQQNAGKARINLKPEKPQKKGFGFKGHQQHKPLGR